MGVNRRSLSIPRRFYHSADAQRFSCATYVMFGVALGSHNFVCSLASRLKSSRRTRASFYNNDQRVINLHFSSVLLRNSAPVWAKNVTVFPVCISCCFAIGLLLENVAHVRKEINNKRAVSNVCRGSVSDVTFHPSTLRFIAHRAFALVRST